MASPLDPLGDAWRQRNVRGAGWDPGGDTVPQGAGSASYPARRVHYRLKAMKHTGGVLGACKSKRALKNGRLLSEVGRDEEPPERALGPCTDTPDGDHQAH